VTKLYHTEQAPLSATFTRLGSLALGLHVIEGAAAAVAFGLMKRLSASCSLGLSFALIS
jgi:hypothetical protein